MFETNFLELCLFPIIFTSFRYLNLSFPLLFYVISAAISSFHLDFPHRDSDSLHFPHFHPDFLHSHADSPHTYPIPWIPTLILCISLILFPVYPVGLIQVAYSVCNV